MITVRLATVKDLDGILAVEEAEFGPPEEGMAASRELMRRRIELCNSKDPGYFWVSVESGRITGYAAIQPTHLKPEECTGWAMATDNGTMERTFDRDGPNVYVVSIASLPPTVAFAGTSDNLVLHIMIRWAERGGVCMMCARIPGFASANAEKGMSVEEYWQLKRTDGSPHDWMLHWLYEMTAHQPARLLRNGYPPDDESMGHGVLVALTRTGDALHAMQKRLKSVALTAGIKLERDRKKGKKHSEHADPRVALLIGGSKTYWDVGLRTFVPATTIYLPQGCGDWNHCTFCSLPNAVRDYQYAFYDGAIVPEVDQTYLFREALAHRLKIDTVHTLFVFNGGSFLSDKTCPPQVRDQLLAEVCKYPFIERLVIESRAELVTEEAVSHIVRALEPYGIQLTIRIGVETQEHKLRNTLLRKGHSGKMMKKAVTTASKLGVRTGGYVLLNPAPLPIMRRAMDDPDATEDAVKAWAVEEATRTLHFVLGKSSHDLHMDEAYFCSTNVGPGTELTKAWERGEFSPATLNMVYDVLARGVRQYGPRIHVLPFSDQPPFLAVSSNHVRGGIAQDLSNAQGCDRAFHAMLDNYRMTMNPHVLVPPRCTCRT